MEPYFLENEKDFDKYRDNLGEGLTHWYSPDYYPCWVFSKREGEYLNDMEHFFLYVYQIKRMHKEFLETKPLGKALYEE